MELVLITGHSSGLGLELTQMFLERDATVIGMSRRSINSKNPRLYQFHFDLSREGNWEDKLRESLPRQDWSRVLLFNCAGTISPTVPFGGMEGAQISRSIEVNVTAPMRLMNIVVTVYKEKTIRIVNVSSGAAKKPYLGWSVYCSSKAALAMASEVLAVEMEAAGRDVKVMSYSPGPLDTPMQAEIRKKKPEDFPQVERFIQLYNDGKLTAPRDAAADMILQIDRKDLPYFLEYTYQ
ncbi:MAG: SDR family NAD(P)-dependent oxidoreductase [Chitinophagaceae bacterium]|nr:SDR family NAD(P)-dependent oxidoreductase [Oligoflexus sp.]